jgi:hypothetical protein
LPEDLRERELHNMFRFAAGFQGARLKPAGSSSSASVGFVLFDSEANADAALNATNGAPIHPREQDSVHLRVSFAKRNLEMNRDLPRREAAVVPYAEPYVYSDPYQFPYDYYGRPTQAALYRPRAGGTPKKRKTSTAAAPINTLYLYNIADSAYGGEVVGDELRGVLKLLQGYSDCTIKHKQGRVVCFVAFDTVDAAAKASEFLNGYQLQSSPSAEGVIAEFAKTEFRSDKK